MLTIGLSILGFILFMVFVIKFLPEGGPEVCRPILPLDKDDIKDAVREVLNEMKEDGL